MNIHRLLTNDKIEPNDLRSVSLGKWRFLNESTFFLEF